jgi:hypothetical protein
VKAQEFVASRPDFVHNTLKLLRCRIVACNRRGREIRLCTAQNAL